MDELLKKVTTYNIFNYLLPGGIFILVIRAIGLTQVEFKSIIVEMLTYYFIGLIISRIGSLLIEPILLKLRFIKFIEYKQYIAASLTDNKIEILSEVNNMYRTLISVFFCVALYWGFHILKFKFSFSDDINNLIVLVIIFILLLFAYKKQTTYIVKRVNTQKKDIING